MALVVRKPSRRPVLQLTPQAPEPQPDPEPVLQAVPGATVYVDDALHSCRGQLRCHLFSLDLDALHAFARRLGLGLFSFQPPARNAWPYYALSFGEREQALELGARMTNVAMTLEVSSRLLGIWTPQRAAWVEGVRAKGRR